MHVCAHAAYILYVYIYIQGTQYVISSYNNTTIVAKQLRLLRWSCQLATCFRYNETGISMSDWPSWWKFPTCKTKHVVLEQRSLAIGAIMFWKILWTSQGLQKAWIHPISSHSKVPWQESQHWIVFILPCPPDIPVSCRVQKMCRAVAACNWNAQKHLGRFWSAKWNRRVLVPKVWESRRTTPPPGERLVCHGFAMCVPKIARFQRGKIPQSNMVMEKYHPCKIFRSWTTKDFHQLPSCTMYHL